jgi:hypothetical protein
VTRLDPTSERAWRRLGFKKLAGTWISPEALNQRELETRDREFASKHWRPKIERWVGQLVGKSPEKSQSAERSLLEITDPRSVPELVRAFAPLPPERHRTLCLVLGQLDAQAASRALAGVAVFSSNAEARRVATEMLARRDAREFADALVASVAKPIRYQVQPLQGPGSPGTVLIEGDEQNYAKHYAVAPMTNTALRRRPAADEAMVYGDDGLPYAVKLPGPGLAQFGGYVSGVSPGSSAFDPFASFSDPAPVRSLLTPNQQRNVRMARDATERLQAQQASDIAAIEATNARIEETNSRVLPILQTVTGFTQGADPVFWQRWWLNQNGLNAADKVAAKANDKDKDTRAEKPTLVEVVSARPDYIPYSCFGNGTLVLTSSGPRAIETIEAGDLVLSQNSTTGVIDYRPVLVAHHNPPSPTLLVTLSNGDVITTSPFHRFWVAARGWVMARDLAEGYVLRTLGGTTRVAAIDGGAEQLVFNLDVADTHTFFVGKTASLVHDQTIPRLRGEAPFDVAALAIGEDEQSLNSSPRERDRAVSRSADALAREPVR